MSPKNDSEALKKMVAEQVEIFTQNINFFEELRNVIIATLQIEGARLPGSPLIHGRVKLIDSFAEKCLRKREKYHKPAWQLTDLCGVRVVVHSLDAIAAVRQCVENCFLILETEDTSGRLKEMEFGYQSVHYIVALDPKKQDEYSTTGSSIPKELFASRSNEEALNKALPLGPVFRAEIQVRTLLQHAWSDAVHDNLYKTDMKQKPQHLLRQSALVAALLEDADTSIVRLTKGASEYRSYYGAYMKPDEIKNEIAIQRIVLSSNPKNKKVALKIARLVDCLEDISELERVEHDLSRFEGTRDAEILRELGMLRWKRGEKVKGRENILESTKLNSQDPDTWCELGLTYFQEKEYFHALKYYRTAFEIVPEYPRALMRFIECKILDGSDSAFEFIPLIKHNLERAIATSRNRINAGIHIPHAWYDIGFFSLLLNRLNESLEAYGKAILTTSSSSVVEAVYDSLTGIHQKTCNRNVVLSNGLKLVRSYLRVILAGRFKKNPQGYLTDCDAALDGYRTLSPCQRENRKFPFTKLQPIVIVAGSCSDESREIVNGYAPILRKAFAEYDGIICCGGTDAGISGIIGHLENREGNPKKLGYLPKGIDRMKEYECIHTLVGEFSAFEPIMLWSDILLSGVSPESVRLLGVRGGEIAAIEYQLALLLGAKVGVLVDSGGASRKIAEDSEWATAVPYAAKRTRKHLLCLRADPESVRSFIHPAAPSKIINAEDREAMAKEIHQKYCELAGDKVSKMLKNLAPWENLDATFKEANFGLIDHIDQKLKRVNLSLRKVMPGAARINKFNNEQLALLAEMEHGRWVIDRLEDGWTLGESDEVKKTRPQLIPWTELSGDEKEKDFDSIRKLPEILALRGYEIFNLEAAV